MEWGVKYEPIAISILENILNIKIKELKIPQIFSKAIYLLVIFK